MQALPIFIYFVLHYVDRVRLNWQKSLLSQFDSPKPCRLSIKEVQKSKNKRKNFVLIYEVKLNFESTDNYN